MFVANILEKLPQSLKFLQQSENPSKSVLQKSWGECEILCHFSLQTLLTLFLWVSFQKYLCCLFSLVLLSYSFSTLTPVFRNRGNPWLPGDQVFPSSHLTDLKLLTHKHCRSTQSSVDHPGHSPSPPLHGH